MNYNSLKDFFPMIIFLFILSIGVLILSIVINRRVFKRYFQLSTIVWGKVIDCGFDDNGRKTITVQYAIGDKQFSITMLKPKLIPYKKGWPFRIECNTLNPSQAVPYSTTPIVVFAIALIISFIIFFAQMR